MPWPPVICTGTSSARIKRLEISFLSAFFKSLFSYLFLDTDQIKQSGLFRFMRPEAKWNACRIDKKSDDVTKILLK